MRKAITLVELLVIAVPALLILALLVHLLVRTTAADRWQGARLGALDALVIASEHVRHDLANCREGQIDLTPDRLAISSAATYTNTSGFRRDGRRLHAAPLPKAAWSWRDDRAALLHVDLMADEARRVSLETEIHVPDRAARAEYASWAP